VILRARLPPPSFVSWKHRYINRGGGLSRTLGYDRAFVVSSSSRSGGLGIYWDNDIKVEILPYSQYYIDAIITENGREPWR
jgi:hypothetical protein